ncbi:hypothetical protein [Bordetella genomosp. 12]|uniref:Lipoprotein n=1 Tax=Bordetella genomosp. 12 TaxID=463035 RepID=A0A261VTX6_9BORD|nr:hypothetical protein [Bordetella genomosp. 12]OZI77489.1 hypothetical protein CAL22_02810 [Bordetella genomosp. 12]
MYSYVSFARAVCGGLIVGAALAGCAAKKQPSAETPAQAPAPKQVTCTPSEAGSPMVGTWYSVSRPRGFGGDLQTLTVLSADGSMTYETQLKVGKRIRPALRESGCWTVANGIYTLQTTKSNGELVDAEDPIYQTRYQVQSVDQSRLMLRELKSGGQQLTARRMQAGYRLPN